jgi:hypothetical protein
LGIYHCRTCWFVAAWCRARRKIEEGKARERYERYVKERAERHEREQKERAEAKRKALEAEERRKKAEEDYNRRKVSHKPEYVSSHSWRVVWQPARQEPNVSTGARCIALLQAGILRCAPPRGKCAAIALRQSLPAVLRALAQSEMRQVLHGVLSFVTLRCSPALSVANCRIQPPSGLPVNHLHKPAVYALLPLTGC